KSIFSLKAMKAASILALAAILSNTNTTQAQWSQLSGLYGEAVYNVVASSNKMFAMTSAGVSSSPIASPSWTIVPPLYLTNVIENLSASGDSIVAYATPDSYFSTNNGTTWSTVPNGPAGVFAGNMVAGASKLFVTTFGDYLYYSVNGGGAWNQITTGLTTPNINSISIDGSKILLGTDDGVFISTNGGGSFSSAGLQNEFINVVYISGSYLFAYGPSGLKQSTNSGTSWIPFDPAIPYSDVTEFLVSGNKVFATTSGILMSSNVNAPTWSQISFNTPIDFNYSICKSGSEILVGSNRGVFGSTDNGVTWNAKTNGLQVQNVNGITTTGTDTIFAGASIYGVSKFSNGNWNYSGLAQLNSNHMKSRGNEVYSACDFGIQRTVDGGNTWQFINNVGPNPVTGFCQRVEVKDTLVLGACLQSGLLRSGDNGATWSFTNNGMPTAQVSCVTVSGSNIVVGTFNEGLYTSTDAGFNWTQTGAPFYLVNDVASIGNKVFAVTSIGNFLSNDNGNSWSSTTLDYYEDLFASNGLMFASGPGYVHVSRDSGLTFPEIVIAPIGTNISSVTASNDFLYIGTVNDGVWKRSISEILDVEEAGMTRPFALILPNIFTEQATLIIDDRMLGSNTELIITDIQGKTIRKSKLNATSTIVPADELAPATYLYSVVKSGNTLHSGKFVISGRK
ncbi:MAG: hypothetical protein RL491_807, partial [Bacteroidota bacterium]